MYTLEFNILTLGLIFWHILEFNILTFCYVFIFRYTSYLVWSNQKLTFKYVWIFTPNIYDWKLSDNAIVLDSCFHVFHEEQKPNTRYFDSNVEKLSFTKEMSLMLRPISMGY